MTISRVVERTALVFALLSMVTNLVGWTYFPEGPVQFLAIAIYLRVSEA